MNLPLKKIIQILNARFDGEDSKNEIENISIDSRSLQNNKSSLFFALIGPNNDAHDYINELISKDVKNFVVTAIPANLQSKANFLVVDNTLTALQNLAAFYRSLFDFPIIGITGSNGKTIVKEWINFLLSPDFNVIRSPKSYNSQVGVPLSIFSINEKHNFGVFEAGISTTKEMVNLQRIINPTIGILTNIGSAHDEGFENISQKIKEKLKLFKDVSVLIYNKNKTIDAFLNPNIKTFSWSSNDKTADILLQKKTVNNHSVLNITFKNECFKIKIPFLDEASTENSIHCVALMMFLNYDVAVIQNRISQLFPVEMRLKVKNGIHSSTIIDDSYSSDFQSLKIALDFLENQKQYKKKTLILSDIFQSGLSNEALYSKVSQLVVANKINRIFAIGTTIASFKSKFVNCTTFQTTNEFIAQFPTLTFGNETILIKGARSFKFEKIVQLLEDKTHETVLEINLNAISHNLNFYKSKLHSQTKLMVMVKAFGYGNGGFEIAKLLEYHKVDYLGVAFADEGIALKTAGINLPIMVLNPESSSFPAIIQHHLEPEIYSFKGLQSFLQIATFQQLTNYPVHIKIDTGMHRLGFEEADIDALIAIFRVNKMVKIKSILSHMATSDDLKHYDFAKKQISLFEKIVTKFKLALKINPICHILNTSGISNFPDSQFDMVRLGIGLYGISNNANEQKYLENVSVLKSIISQIRTIQKDESVGYGRRFIATRETKIATIPIGYADGISRQWGNELGYVVINSKKATIVGSICMDMLMVDVSDINCNEGDQVVIFGESPTVIEIAEKLQTIPYEILTSISQRVKRIFYRE